MESFDIILDKSFVASDSCPPEDSDNVFLTDPFAPGGDGNGILTWKSFSQLIKSSNQTII